MKQLNFLRIAIMAIMAMSFVIVMTACAGLENYQLGDFSKSYCTSTDPVFRGQIKDLAKRQGIVLNVDYCTAHGLVDAMVRSGNNRE